MSKRSCCGAEVAALQQELGALYVTIEDLATDLHCTIEQAEVFLWGTKREHNPVSRLRSSFTTESSSRPAVLPTGHGERYGHFRDTTLDLVWLSKEEVGPRPIFIARVQGDGFDVTLYSALPEEQWRRHQ
jgi:hypothetical protein